MARSYQKMCTVCSYLVEYHNRNKPEVCPSCGDPYWDKPKDERDLFLLQEEYMETRSEKDFLAMYNKIKTYARNVIVGKIRNSYRMSQDLLEEKIDDLSQIMLEKYLSDENYCVKYSFGGLLKRIANGVLYSKKNEESNESLEKSIWGGDIELQDQFLSVGGKSLAMDDMDFTDAIFNKDEYVVETLYKSVEELATKLRETGRHGTYDSLIFLIGVRHFFNNIDYRINDQFLSMFPAMKKTTDKAILEMKKWLKNNRREEVHAF